MARLTVLVFNLFHHGAVARLTVLVFNLFHHGVLEHEVSDGSRKHTIPVLWHAGITPKCYFPDSGIICVVLNNHMKEFHHRTCDIITTSTALSFIPNGPVTLALLPIPTGARKLTMFCSWYSNDDITSVCCSDLLTIYLWCSVPTCAGASKEKMHLCI